MSFISGIAGAGATMYGANKQYDASEDAQKMQWNMYNQTRSDLSPYMGAGSSALPNLMSLLGLGSGGSSGMMSTLQNMPGYQFALQQGQQGVDRGMAARGLGVSGGEMKSIDQYSQGLASQNYNNLVSQLFNVAGMGENAAAGVGTAGMNAATNSGEAGMWGAQQFSKGLVGATGDLFGQGGATSGMNWGDVSSFAEMLSDERAKDDIEQIGELPSGLPVYSFRYKGSELPQIGVMAQDVEKRAPAAVSAHHSGLKTVNYHKVARLPARRPVSDLPAMRMAA